MKNYIQHGKTITHTPTAAVLSGEAVLIGLMLAVAIANVPVNTPGEFAAAGVYELPKASAATFAQGAQVYWDNTAKTITATASGNTPVGKAWAAAGNGETKMQVKINV